MTGDQAVRFASSFRQLTSTDAPSQPYCPGPYKLVVVGGKPNTWSGRFSCQLVWKQYIALFTVLHALCNVLIGVVVHHTRVFPVESDCSYLGWTPFRLMTCPSTPSSWSYIVSLTASRCHGVYIYSQQPSSSLYRRLVSALISSHHRTFSRNKSAEWIKFFIFLKI